MSRWKCPVVLLTVCLSSRLLVGPVTAASCPDSGGETVRIAAVEPRLELRLADGRLLRLAGLDPSLQTPADPDLGETARTRLAALVGGREVTVHILANAPDRWGRFVGFVVRTDGIPSEVATEAIAEGLGRYLAEPAARSCRGALLAAEEKARVAKLGLWSDPYYSVLAADDGAGFSERSGTIVLAEGRLTGVQVDPYRTTLRFAASKVRRNSSGTGSFGGHMLVATILPRNLKTFEAQKVDLKALIGQQIRFRGLLDLRFGPRIELSSPDEVELEPGSIAPPVEAAPPSHPN